MRYLPHHLQPGGGGPYNGQPTLATHAQYLDAYQTWLAGVRKIQPPAIGPVLAGTYTIDLMVPSYTAYVAWQFLVWGRGNVTITNDVDGYNSVTNIEALAPSQNVDSAVYQYTGGPATPGANGSDRALSVTNDNAYGISTFVVDISDYDANHTIVVYAMRPIFLPPGPGSVLPT